MKKETLIAFARTGYSFVGNAASSLQSLFLLAIRLHWGWQFFQTGLGKLMHIDKIVAFFGTLGIPFPTVNAYMAGTTECLGGLCLFLGFGSRLITIPLIFTMLVAYATAEKEALHSLFSDPDKFTSADPFLFMLTAIIVLIFGPGLVSVDALIKRLADHLSPEEKMSPSLSPSRNIA